jgi:arginase family enzyme
MFEFLEPLSIQDIQGDANYNGGHYGTVINKFTQTEIDWQEAQIIIVGINEKRGTGILQSNKDTDAIRKHLYRLYQWHSNITIADIGNIKIGKSLADTYAATQMVVSELLASNKTVILIGGSHDVTLAQYNAYAKNKLTIEATCIDATIDLSLDSPFRSDNFLVEMLTSEPNFIKHYNHLGFQSYFVHPQMMETLDGLRFDCHRVGKVREKIQLYEPVFRNSNMVSIDVHALQNAYMPCNTVTPNGFAGDEACMLAKYAGMSNALSSIGFYNYSNAKDQNEIGAIQIAQMIWYFIDGRNALQQEKDISQKEYYKEYTTAFADVNITFYQNKENNKWWMLMPNGKCIACNYEDYLQASQNDLPETWLRHQERLV